MGGWWSACWVWVMAFVATPALAQTVGVLVPDDEALLRTVDLFEDDHPGVDVQRFEDAAAAVEAGVVAVVGHAASDAEATAAAQALKAASIPFVASNATSRSVAKVGDGVFVADATQDRRAEHLVAHLEAVVGAERIAIAHDRSLQGYADVLVAKAEAVGLEVTKVAPWSAEPDAAYMRSTFEDFERAPRLNRRDRRFARLFGRRGESTIDRKLGVDAIVVLGDASDSGVAVHELREAGVELPIFCSAAAASPGFGAEAGDDVSDVYAITTYSPDLANVQARAFARRFDPAPSQDAVLLYESLELLAAAIAATDGSPGAVTADLRDRQMADRAVEGLGGLLFVDADGVMQRDPWMLLLDRGRFRPAYTQLRPVVDPRELWAATQAAEEAEESDDRRRRDDDEASDETQSRTVLVGGRPYHRTAVVYAGIDFFRVNEVDIGGQAFDVELYLWFRWQGEVDVENIGFLNQINTEDALFEVVREDRDSPTRYVCYKVKARFLTPYDLHDFPFDQQRLPVQVSHTTLDSRDLLLVVDHDRLSHEAIRAIYPEEWEYVGRRDASATYAPTTTFGDPAYEGLASRSEFSLYQTEIVLDRILFPYLITLFLPLGIMVGISLFVVLIPPSQFDARLTLTMTALLSVVVFHLAQGEDLPNVGYLMRADQYFMVAYLLLFVLIIKTVIVNLLVPRMSQSTITRGEWVFAILFIPATLLMYGTLSFDSPLEWLADRWLRPPPAEGIDTVVMPDDATDQAATTGAATEVAPPAPGPPPVERDPHELYAMCNGEVVSLSSIVQPITERMSETEIPYTQSKAGGDQLRDCSGNFLRVSSHVAGQCKDGAPWLAASEGVVDWIPGGGSKNVFEGTYQEWTDEDGNNHAARSSRGVARWYAKNGLFTPLWTNDDSLERFRDQIKPGMVVWFGRDGQSYTERAGTEKMFTHRIGIVHMGVVHSVQRDEATGDVVSYKMYHGRRPDPKAPDNGITDHSYEPGGSWEVPFGNGRDPLVAWAPLLPTVE